MIKIFLFALLRASSNRSPTQAHFSERDHAQATRASLLDGFLPEPWMSSFRALAFVKRVFFVCFSFAHFFVFLSFCRLSVQNITHHMTKLYTSVKTSSYNSTVLHVHDYCKTPSGTNHYKQYRTAFT